MKIDLTVAGFIFFDNKVLLVYHASLQKWLPVGGHIENNETPDETLKREAKEEVNLDIEILGQSKISTEGNIIKNLAVPFYANLHSVGDHWHYGLFYVCRALNPAELKINRELKDAVWFSQEEIENKNIPIDVRNQAKEAFRLFYGMCG